MRQPLHERGHAFVTLAAGPSRPVHGRAFANLGLPLSVLLGQVVGEEEGRARAVSAAHHGDVAVGQLHARVQCGDGRVVPLLQLAQVDVAQYSPRQTQLARRDTRQIDHGHDAADDGGELHQAVFAELGVGERHVGSAEVHRLAADLAQPRTRPDRLVVDTCAGGLVVGIGPLGIQRRRKCGASAGGVLGQGGCDQRQRCEGDGQAASDERVHCRPREWCMTHMQHCRKPE